MHIIDPQGVTFIISVVICIALVYSHKMVIYLYNHRIDHILPFKYYHINLGDTDVGL